MDSETSRKRGSRTTVLFAVVAVAAVIVGAVAVTQLTGDDDDQGGPASSGTSSTSPSDGPDRLLVSPAAEGWGSQTVEDCASYEPAAEPEVVYVPDFAYECVVKVPEDSSAIFSSASAQEIGGISWDKGSQPWVELSGQQVMKKIEGDEFNITDRVIQGVWLQDGSEYAVYVGPESPAALDALEASE
ncbi:hypothetical protein [Nocardioides lijunqiniae]|uniref:hypothetical protein n=1 Tax=Nocardioides lijunqiniae TaxID=2760832 RepID=UPI001877C62E|nr:hypothetical protein [Nocardioides lijunqiniae]